MDFGDPIGMTTAFERGAEPILKDGFHFVGGEITPRQTQYVRIVVLHRHGGDFRVPNQRGTNAGNPVGRHGHALTASTNENATLIFSVAHSMSHKNGVIGVIDRCFAVRAVVDGFVAERLQQGFRGFFGRVTGMVTCDRDNHGLNFANFALS
jgi:hypothetical protein